MSEGANFSTSQALRIRYWIGRAETIVSALLLGIIVVANIFEITSRYIFSESIYFVQEGTILGAGWMTFIGASALFKRHEFIQVLTLVSKLPPRTALAASLIWKTASIITLLVIFYYTVLLVRFQSGLLNETLGVSDVWYYLPVLYASLSIALTLMLDCFVEVRGVGVASQSEPSILGG